MNFVNLALPSDPVPLGHPVGPQGSGDEGDPPSELPEGLGLEPDFLKEIILKNLTFT